MYHRDDSVSMSDAEAMKPARKSRRRKKSLRRTVTFSKRVMLYRRSSSHTSSRTSSKLSKDSRDSRGSKSSKDSLQSLSSIGSLQSSVTHEYSQDAILDLLTIPEQDHMSQGQGHGVQGQPVRPASPIPCFSSSEFSATSSQSEVPSNQQPPQPLFHIPKSHDPSKHFHLPMPQAKHPTLVHPHSPINMPPQHFHSDQKVSEIAHWISKTGQRTTSSFAENPDPRPDIHITSFEAPGLPGSYTTVNPSSDGEPVQISCECLSYLLHRDRVLPVGMGLDDLCPGCVKQAKESSNLLSVDRGPSPGVLYSPQSSTDENYTGFGLNKSSRLDLLDQITAFSSLVPSEADVNQTSLPDPDGGSDLPEGIEGNTRRETSSQHMGHSHADVPDFTTYAFNDRRSRIQSDSAVDYSQNAMGNFQTDHTDHNIGDKRSSYGNKQDRLLSEFPGLQKLVKPIIKEPIRPVSPIPMETVPMPIDSDTCSSEVAKLTAALEGPAPTSPMAILSPLVPVEHPRDGSNQIAGNRKGLKDGEYFSFEGLFPAYNNVPAEASSRFLTPNTGHLETKSGLLELPGTGPGHAGLDMDRSSWEVEREADKDYFSFTGLLDSKQNKSLMERFLDESVGMNFLPFDDEPGSHYDLEDSDLDFPKLPDPKLCSAFGPGLELGLVNAKNNFHVSFFNIILESILVILTQLVFALYD